MSQPDQNLTFPEELLLLALCDQKGTHAFGSMLPYALAGGILTELMLARRVEVDRSGKRKQDLVTLCDPTPLGDPILDDALERIATAKRRGTAQTWVSRLAGRSGLRADVARALCRRGVLEEREDRVLLLFRRRVYPTVNPEPERRLIERLRAAVIDGGEDIGPRTAVTLALADGVGVLPAVFTKAERREHKARIKALGEGLIVGQATREAIQAVQAMLIATTAATTVATSTTTR
jgi:golgi phosphoprotein 3